MQSYGDHSALYKLWEEIESGEAKDWDRGAAFQNLVLRAFELEGATVTYPYRVGLFEETIVEELDGFIEVPGSNLMVLAECKDHQEDISIEAIAKLRNQLARRPSSLLGSIFAKRNFTSPAKILAHFLAPQTVLLWSGADIDYCLRNRYFVKGLEEKYRQALLSGKPDHDLENMKVV